MSEIVPSSFHCPTSPVLNHPSFAKIVSSEFKSGLLKYPFESDGPRMQISPVGGLFREEYPASGMSINFTSTEGAGSPTEPVRYSSGGRTLHIPEVSVIPYAT